MHCQNTISCDKIENTIFGSVIIGKDEVGGSNPPISSMNPARNCRISYCFGAGLQDFMVFPQNT